jgi:hypothetical protein
MERTTKAT